MHCQLKTHINKTVAGNVPVVINRVSAFSIRAPFIPSFNVAALVCPQRFHGETDSELFRVKGDINI